TSETSSITSRITSTSVASSVSKTTTMSSTYSSSSLSKATTSAQTKFASSTSSTGTTSSVATSTAALIPDYYTCVNNGTCATSSFLCCVAPGDVSTGKTTCRPSTDCAYSTSTSIADYNNCQQGVDICQTSSFVCCVAPADFASGKTTCRPTSDCSTQTAIPDYSPCTFGQTCASASSVCCIGPGSSGVNDLTCRNPSSKLKVFISKAIYNIYSAACVSRPADLWSGVNSYFLHTLPENDQLTILSDLQAAGVSKVRIFVTSFGAGGKGTDSVGVDDLEMETIGAYNDTILSQIDQLMARMYVFNMKLILCMHDRWVLSDEYGICDAYCIKYNKNSTAFYNDPAAFTAFDKRLAHIVTHVNPFFNTAYKNLDSVLYAVELQNEAQGTGSSGGGLTNTGWWCDRATALKTQMAGSKVLVSTGGGQTFSTSLLTQNFNCAALDVVALHSYTTDIVEVATNLATANSLKGSNQAVVFEEFGLNTPTKNVWIDHVAQVANIYNISWMPWEVSTVNKPNDYEFSPADNNTWAALKKNSPH
ncbi:hypothetical protein HDU82_005781, partial [Entophlyctis luteolus]